MSGTRLCHRSYFYLHKSLIVAFFLSYPPARRKGTWRERGGWMHWEERAVWLAIEGEASLIQWGILLCLLLLLPACFDLHFPNNENLILLGSFFPLLAFSRGSIANTILSWQPTGVCKRSLHHTQSCVISKSVRPEETREKSRKYCRTIPTQCTELDISRWRIEHAPYGYTFFCTLV